MPPARTQLVPIAPKKPPPASVHPVCQFPTPFYATPFHNRPVVLCAEGESRISQGHMVFSQTGTYAGHRIGASMGGGSHGQHIHLTCNQADTEGELPVVSHRSFLDQPPHSHSVCPHVATQPMQTYYLPPSMSFPRLTRPRSPSRAIRLNRNIRAWRSEPPGITIRNTPNVSMTRPIPLLSQRNLERGEMTTRSSYSRSGDDALKRYQHELLEHQNRERMGSSGCRRVEVAMANTETRSSPPWSRWSVGSPFPNASSDGPAQPDKGDCKICFDNAGDYCLVPCGHTRICGTCAGKIDYCPFCRRKVNIRQQLFKP